MYLPLLGPPERTKGRGYMWDGRFVGFMTFPKGMYTHTETLHYGCWEMNILLLFPSFPYPLNSVFHSLSLPRNQTKRGFFDVVQLDQSLKAQSRIESGSERANRKYPGQQMQANMLIEVLQGSGILG